MQGTARMNFQFAISGRTDLQKIKSVIWHKRQKLYEYNMKRHKYETI